MVLARCCLFQGEAVYHGEMEALEDLTGPEMEQLLRRISQGGGKIAGAANQEFDMERFERLSGR